MQGQTASELISLQCVDKQVGVLKKKPQTYEAFRSKLHSEIQQSFIFFS